MSLFANQRIFIESLFHANDLGADQQHADLMFVARLQAPWEELLLLFCSPLHCTTNPAECLAHRRSFRNVIGMNEWERQRERRGYSVRKGIGAFHHPEHASWSTSNLMNSERHHMHCTAVGIAAVMQRSRGQELWRIQPFVFFCLPHKRNEGRSTVNLPVSCMSSTCFNTATE